MMTGSLEEINQMIEDMTFAELQAKEKGLKPGDYDLVSLTGIRAMDRIKQEMGLPINQQNEGIPTEQPIMGIPPQQPQQPSPPDSQQVPVI